MAIETMPKRPVMVIEEVVIVQPPKIDDENGNHETNMMIMRSHNRGLDIDMFEPSTNMSNVWKGITENAKWVSKGSAVAIGDGRSTLFWDHCWATDVPLRDLIIDPIPEALDGAIVEELWEPGTGWRWDLFAHLLPPHILKLVASHKVMENTELGDLRYWKGSKTGGFSIKYALSIIKNDEHIMTDPKWELAWTSPVQQRVRVFLWLILHNRILCNANRLQRHLTDDPRCSRCAQNTDETLLHLFPDCPIARNIWKSVGGTACYPSFYQGDLQGWITRNLEANGFIFSEKWPICFALTIWWMWKWRNCALFGRNAEILIDTGLFLKPKIDETWRVFMGDNEMTSSRKREVLISWTAPPLDWAALNTDGAARGSPGPAGGGGVLRDCRGHFIRGFAANFGHCNAYKAEVLALELGLRMAQQQGITKLIIQMDNKACIEALQNDQLLGGEYVHLLSVCRNIISSFGNNIRMFHCYREGNKVADRLANVGIVRIEGITYFDVPPIEIRDTLREDVIGVTTPRFVA